ncbi:hypothetical protein BDP81DRAFT_395643 [Colletotrichum phormii]|uniref:Uncharacterized protein n=1 Tax=Colletotrichum phormii TaxID=359342 RepID=A0AAI9ZR57_9PEZI|nr:uncharacterized protein BDP81DRAFT_395643 [Colletotrichum phormii]KAK1635177.1 hypothetical protein BDP81DRAFT_395643 [Colletotrichum phormii]
MEEAGGRRRALRRSTQEVQRGRYQEQYALGVQRPAWVHPDPVFDPGAARWASFPTIPLDQRGQGDEYVEARDRGELDAWLREQNLSPEHFSDDEEEEEDDRPVAEEREVQGEDSMDWGSPGEGESISWAHLSHGAQWILLEVLCGSQSFALAARALGLTTPEVITFVVSYIQHHREIQARAKTCDEMDPSELLDQIHERAPPRDGMNVLNQPFLPTHTIKYDEYEKAYQYLRQIGLGEHIRGLERCRGISEGFLEIHIEREILAACIAILEKGTKDSALHEVDTQIHDGPQSWHDQFDPKHHELVNRMIQIQAYLPHLDHRKGNPASTSSSANPTEQHDTPTLESVSEPQSTGQVYARNNPMFGENNQYAWVFDNLDMDELYTPTEVHKYRNRPAISYEDFQSAADGSPEVTAVQEHDQSDEHQLPGDEVLDEAFPKAQVNNQPAVPSFPFDGLLPEAQEIMPCPSTPEPEPVVDHTRILTNLSLPELQAQDDQPAQQSASSAVLQPVFSYIDEVDPNTSPSDSPAYEYFQSSEFKAILRNTKPQWYLDEMALPVERPEMPTSQATAQQIVAQEASHDEDMPDAAMPDASSNANFDNELSNPISSTNTSGFSRVPEVSAVSKAPAVSEAPAASQFPTVSRAPDLFQVPRVSAVPQIPKSSALPQVSQVSRASGISKVSAVPAAQEPRFALKDAVVPVTQEEITFYNNPIPVAGGSQRAVIDLPGDSARSTAGSSTRPMGGTPARPVVATPMRPMVVPPARHNNIPRTPALREDSPEPPSTKSSTKPSRKRPADDSDGEYVPDKPKKARRSKKATVVPPPLPQPQQMGPNGVLQPVKRGRGRPRKYPRPEDIAAAQAAANQVANQATAMQTPANSSPAPNAASPPAGNNPVPGPEQMAPQAPTVVVSQKPRTKRETNQSSESSRQASVDQPHTQRTAQFEERMTPVSRYSNEPSNSYTPQMPDFRADGLQTTSYDPIPNSFSFGMQPSAAELRQSSLPSAYESSNSYLPREPDSRADARQMKSYDRMPASFTSGAQSSATQLRHSSVPSPYTSNSYNAQETDFTSYGRHLGSQEALPVSSTPGMHSSTTEHRSSSRPEAYPPSNSYFAQETDFTTYRRQPGSYEPMPTSFTSEMQSSTADLRQPSLPGANSRPLAPMPPPEIQDLTGREASMPAVAPGPNRASFQQSSDTPAPANNPSQVDRMAPGAPRQDKHGRLFPPQYETYEEFWEKVPDGADYVMKMVEKGWPSHIAMQLARERLAMNMASWPNSIYSIHYQPNAARTPFPGVTASIRREIEAEKATAAAQLRKDSERADD